MSGIDVEVRQAPLKAEQCALSIANTTYLMSAAPFQFNNFGHLLIDGLAPLFQTMRMTERLLHGRDTIDRSSLVLLRCNCHASHILRPLAAVSQEVLAMFTALPQLLFLDDLAHLDTCFSTLVVGLDTSMFLGHNFASRAIHASDVRQARYSAFVQHIVLMSGVRPEEHVKAQHAGMVLRRSSRRLVNFKEVQTLLAEQSSGGVVVLQFEEMRLQSVISEMMQLDLLVCALGAGMANAVFMSASSVVLALNPFNVNMYWWHYIWVGGVDVDVTVQLTVLTGSHTQACMPACLHACTCTCRCECVGHSVVIVPSLNPLFSFPRSGGVHQDMFVPRSHFAKCSALSWSLLGVRNPSNRSIYHCQENGTCLHGHMYGCIRQYR